MLAKHQQAIVTFEECFCDVLETVLNVLFAALAGSAETKLVRVHEKLNHLVVLKFLDVLAVKFVVEFL